MPRPSTLLAALLAAAAALAPATASTLENATGGAVAYQFDAGTHHDAPDACGKAAAAWNMSLGVATDGVLVPPDDLSDVFLLKVPADGIGQRLDVQVHPSPEAVKLNLTVHAPGCAGDVFDPTNQPASSPAPPPPGSGEAQMGVQNQNGTWECDPTQWFFVVNQLPGPAPPSLHAAWTDGTEHAVALLHSSNRTAHYAVADHLGVTLKGAWINLPASWEGSFRIGAGPCNAVDGGAVYGEPPVAGLGTISFTPVRAGPYVVQVTYGAPLGLLPPVPDPSADPEPSPPGAIVVPATCHFCRAEVEQIVRLISYRVVATRS